MSAVTSYLPYAVAAWLFGVGLYGIAAYTVSRQRSEIGVRMALGATPRGVMRLVLGRVSVLVVVGVGVGVVLSLLAGRAVRLLLHGLEPNDAGTLAGAAAVLLLTGSIAGLIPAWRAARTDPSAALRQ